MSKKPVQDNAAFDNPWSSESGVGETTGPSQQRRSEASTLHTNSEYLPAQSQQVRIEEPAAVTNNDAPPVYSAGPSDLATGVPRALRNAILPGVPHIDFSKYRIPESTLSNDQVTVTTTLAPFSSDPRALETFIREQAALPPRPIICITGTRASNIDFHIKLNMIRYIIHPNEKWNFVKISTSNQKPSKKSEASGGDGLAEWAKRFCKDSAMIKSFVLQREVTNWNTDLIEGRIRSLLASMGYRGQLQITFPVAHSQVIVHSAPKTHRLFTSLLSNFVDTKRYEVVKAYWPYATVGPDSHGSSALPRQCAVQTEEAWWKDWCDVIRCGVLAGRSGWLSMDDQIELAMNPTLDLSEKMKNWGIDR